MTRTHHPQSDRRVSLLLVALAVPAPAALVLGGCYERVVDARGPGADQYQVSEPYQESSRIDRWIYGDDSDTRNRRGGTRLPKN